MRRLLTVAALLLAGSAAHAGDSYSFEVGGRTIHIEAPNDCDSPSCVSVSIPGVYESGPKRAKRAHANLDNNSQGKAASQAKAAPPGKAAPQARVEPAPAPAKSGPSAEPAASSGAVSTATVAPPSVASPRTSEPAPQAPASAVVATAPASDPVQAPVAAANQPAASPLGMWQTEEKKGLIRIEACGANLCGYSVDAKTNQNGEKILIDMTSAADSKWTGRIHDPKSGSDYDSTIALKGPDSLRVQGCALGGMFCGGQTWSRPN